MTKHVLTIKIKDPDTNEDVEIEIRKDMEMGAMIGIDGSYLENTDKDVYDPYNEGRILEIPDDETGPMRVGHVVVNNNDNPKSSVIVVTIDGEGNSPTKQAINGWNNLKNVDGVFCTVVGQTSITDVDLADPPTFAVIDTDESTVVLVDDEDICKLWADRHNSKVITSGGEACYIVAEMKDEQKFVDDVVEYEVTEDGSYLCW